MDLDSFNGKLSVLNQSNVDNTNVNHERVHAHEHKGCYFTSEASFEGSVDDNRKN